ELGPERTEIWTKALCSDKLQCREPCRSLGGEPADDARERRSRILPVFYRRHVAARARRRRARDARTLHASRQAGADGAADRSACACKHHAMGAARLGNYGGHPFLASPRGKTPTLPPHPPPLFPPSPPP